MTPDQQEALKEIRRLLEEAYGVDLARDGCGKSGEGAIDLGYPAYFWREDEPERVEWVSIYSYCFSPYRRHYWFGWCSDNRCSGDEWWVTGCPVRAALEEVRKWHKETMAFEYD